MTTIALKLDNVKFLGWQHRNTGADLKSLSDKALEDRRDLNAVKPFWMA